MQVWGDRYECRQVGIGGLCDYGSTKRVRLHTQASRATHGGEASEIVGTRGAPRSTATAATATARENATEFAAQLNRADTAASTANKREW